MKTPMDKILSSVAGRRILVIGDVMLDKYLWGDASRLSPEAPVPVVRLERETAVAGGAANVAFNIASLGATPELFGWIGADPDGDRLRGLLAAGGVSLVPEAVRADRETIVKTRVVCRRQQICRLDREADPSKYSVTAKIIDSAILPAIERADAVLLSDYAKGLLSTKSIARIIACCLRLRRKVMLDPKPRPGVDYSGVNLMTPNRAEAFRLAGMEDVPGPFPAAAVCRAIYAKFAPEHLVITMGADGMLLSEGGKPLERMPTFAREVFDVSGAGDTVIAAMTLALAAGNSLRDAARFANTAAGVVVGKLGTATATPDEIRSHAALLP